MNVNRIKFLIAGAVLLSAFLFLFLTSFQSENLSYFLTVDEIADKGQSLSGQGIRVEGKLVPNSLSRNSKAMRLSFSLQGEKSVLPVNYTGVPPDLLENGFPVIAEGKINAQGVLVAKNLMVACPSKFTEMQKAGEEVPGAADHLRLINISAAAKKTESKN
jgi:cytochrome c-type biogenesis protein CcmE